MGVCNTPLRLDITAVRTFVGWVEQQTFIPLLPNESIGETQHPNLPLLNTDNVN